MRRMLPAIAVLWPSLALAAVLNVEFKFTPYTGDLKEDHVDSVPGTARVVVNGVPYAEQPVEKKTLPVIFDDREVAASVWVPVQSVGSLVRKGKNVIRIEFEPSDPKAAYKAQLRWASVTDQVKEDDSGAGSYRGTNQAGEGRPARASRLHPPISSNSSHPGVPRWWCNARGAAPCTASTRRPSRRSRATTSRCVPA